MKQRFPIRLCGTGAYVPLRVIDNQHFIDYLDTTDEWILTRTGIRERRKAADNEFTSTLAANAARKALEDAAMTIEDIDVIICATATGDCQFPSTATFVAGELGAGTTPAFDVAGACAGFIYATAVAGSFLTSGMYRTALVIGAETLTRWADYEDRSTCVLFGDGAGAAVLARSVDPERGILHCDLGCDGTKSTYIWAPAGGSRLPASAMTVAERLHYLRMRGREVYKFAVVKMQELIENALKDVGMKAEELKLLIPHQSNLRILESVRDKLGLPREKVAVNIDKFGNTSAASIPLALDEARRNGTLHEGDVVLMTAIGAGLAWGTMVFRL